MRLAISLFVMLAFSQAMTFSQATFAGGDDAASHSDAASRPQSRPNILWITSEDNGPELGCYGDDYADTPNLDALAAKSLIYRTCWSNAPVCAPARTCLISGMYATSLGGHHMRSGITIPDDVVLYPQAFRDAGYYCTNNSKTDYNFSGRGRAPKTAGWNESGRKAHWRNRPNADTPFFAVFNSTISHESKIRVRPHTPVHDAALAPVPAYHPDTPEVRRDWAQYYDKVTAMDAQLGKVLKELQDDGLAESTIVFYYGDHGSGMPRSKRWPFNSGLHVPLIIHIPEAFKDSRPADYAPGKMTDRLAAFVDMAPTALSLAGIKPPASMQGVPLAGKYEGPAKPYLFGFRGRMDERIDLVRSCTDGRYVYMLHFYPDRPYLKYVNYMFQTPTTRIWKEMFDAGKLNKVQAKVWQNKPVEELFDLESDPDEIRNLAGLPAEAERLATMRQAVRDWMVDSGDLGLMPESEMHRQAGDRPLRELVTGGTLDVASLVDCAIRCINSGQVQTDSGDAYLMDRLQSENVLERFWAARAWTCRPRFSDATQAVLLDRLDDSSPSVAVAAADALLDSRDAAIRSRAVDRLIELANPKQSDQFAAVAALNVLDMNATLTSKHLARISELPRKADPPPFRAEGYVGRLLDHLIPTESE
ncbi:MAG: sulfatase [Planctomycetota bacterium]